MGQLNSSYFYGPLTIAQMTEDSVGRNVDWFITMYEEKFLRLLLGDNLYTAYVTGIDANDPNYTALRDQIYKTANNVYISPAANYVYWFYMRNEVTQTTGTGEKKVEGENAVNVSSQAKVKTAWNSMVEMNRSIIKWINNYDPAFADWVDWPSNTWFGARQESLERLDIVTRIGL